MVLMPTAMGLYGIVDGNGFLIGFIVLTAMWQWDFTVLLTAMGFYWVPMVVLTAMGQWDFKVLVAIGYQLVFNGFLWRY